MITDDILEQIEMIEQDIDYCHKRMKERDDYRKRLEANKKELDRLSVLYDALGGKRMEGDYMEYTAQTLFEKLSPIKVEMYDARLTESGLSLNLSTIFCPLIKDAARCNAYQSDIYYDLCEIDKRLKNFKPEEEFEPIWIGFRKCGVDGNNYILNNINNGESVYMTLSRTYFALYSISVTINEYGFYHVVFSEYGV